MEINGLYYTENPSCCKSVLMLEYFLLMAKFPWTKVFWAFAVLIIAANAVQWTGQTAGRLQNPSIVPFHSLGFKFMGLEKILANQTYAGYYTDKNMDNSLTVAQFEQAQYMLSPTVLDLNNTNHPLVIFDCTTPAAGMAKIKELGLVPASISNTGIILAYDPKVSNAP